MPHALIRSGVDPTLLRVYLVIASYADMGDANECTAARETIAEAAGCSVATVKRSIGVLRRDGWVEVEERIGWSSIIRPIPPKDVELHEIDTHPGQTDPGVGHSDPGSGQTDPGVGSHRPTKKTEIRRRKEEDGEKKTPKSNAGVRRPISQAQMTMLSDLVLMQDHDEPNPESYVRDLVGTYDEADELIKEYWQIIEHIGRWDIARDAHRDSRFYYRLSSKGREFVDREDDIGAEHWEVHA